MAIQPDLSTAFAARVGRTARIFRAPGRINLIGEHTDYTGGFVMPMAIAQSAWVAAAPRADRRVIVESLSFGEEVAIDLDRLPSPRRGHWSDYVAGVCAVLDREVRLSGANLLLESAVPIGAGLSSSAAIETACGVALLDAAGAPLDRTALALACQRAEHEFAGIHCGVMDQYIACHGRAGHALLLDTRDLTAEWLQLPAGVGVLACNTMVRHELASAEYNARRADCEEGLRMLAAHLPNVRALRDVSPDGLESAKGTLPDRVYRRCRHVVTENARVRRMGEALRASALGEIGPLMRASHESLRTDYDVTCPELDLMADVAERTEGVIGARMTGGGFGGSVVALVRTSAQAAAADAIAREYARASGVRPDVWVCEAADGAGRVEMDGGR